MAQRLLIVDDEADIVRLLERYFSREGYLVSTAADGAEALRKLGSRPDLILLDIGLPRVNGIEVCRKIRDFVSCPILFLTAKVSEPERIQGFAAGGDDYICKPFSLGELGARVAAHLRREARPKRLTRVIFDGDFALDFAERQAYFQGRPISLAKKEFDILELLSQHPGQVFDKERIYERVWGWDSEGDSAVVPERIRRIRVKLQAAGARPYIETVWGVGYKWSRANDPDADCR